MYGKFSTPFKPFTVNQKTGFRNVTGKRILILDANKKPFYDTDTLNHKVWDFNLPPGQYFKAEGHIRQRSAPLEYAIDALPPREKKVRFDPEKFPIVFGDNPFRASVFWDPERSPFGKCVIFFDKSMRYVSRPEFVFIYYHELGHRWWDNERACDIYASNRMLHEGYNPSQIGFAMVHTLSDNNIYRKELMVDSMVNK